MEEQETIHSQQDSSSSDHDTRTTNTSTLPLTAESPNLESSTNSVPTLRFPTPEGSQHLATWVSSSIPDIMPLSPPTEQLFDDSNSLSDSAYEIISSVDGESQDGHHTESLADSLEMYPRGDDVRSLGANTPTHDEDTESEYEDEHTGQSSDLDEDHIAAEEQSRSDSIRYAEVALQNPSATSSRHLGDDSFVESRTASLVLNEDTIGADLPHTKYVTGKCLLREYSDEETAELVEALHLPDHGKQLKSSVCQVMSPQYLSTRKPLRILYVGSEAARTDIMHKISSAILASDSSENVTQHSRRNSDGTFNIVPISSFGSDKVPEADEIQLMGVSDYYINVSRCASAKEILRHGASDHQEATFSITTECGKTYFSSEKPSSANHAGKPSGCWSIEPSWAVPDLAIFYLSGNDDEEAEETTHAAWEFMTRHGVPSIFISHGMLQPMENKRRWQQFVERGAVHILLEAEIPGHEVLYWRHPIDLASFMSLDARQLNRNLAFLTGNVESIEDETRHGPGMMFMKGFNAPFDGFLKSCREVKAYEEIMLLMFAIFTVSLGVALMQMLPLLGFTPAASTDGTRELITTSTLTTTCAVPTMIPTVTINVVSTKTVHLGVDETTHVFGGFISDKAASSLPKTDPEPKKVSCSIEIYSDNEVLIKIPSKKAKSAWLAAGAIDIDVWRGEEILKSKLSSTDEGIMIEIPKKDAYGVMNVSVLARKPKINETFAINFGRSPFAEAFDAGTTLLHNVMSKVFDSGETFGEAWNTFDETCYSFADSWRHNTQLLSEHVKEAREAARKAAREAYDSAKPERVSDAVQELRAQIKHTREQVLDGVDITLRRAQVESKLWWLKVRGDKTEHNRYEKKAREFLDKMERVAEKKRAAFEERPSKAKLGRHGDGQRRQNTRANGFEWLRRW